MIEFRPIVFGEDNSDDIFGHPNTGLRRLSWTMTQMSSAASSSADTRYLSYSASYLLR